MESELVFQLEYPTDGTPIYSNVHTATGWCFHTSDTIHAIRLFVNDELSSEAIMRYPRMDVASQYTQHWESSLFSGFRCHFDPRKLSEGRNRFEFQVIGGRSGKHTVRVDVHRDSTSNLMIGHVFVDVVGGCNLQCSMCPQGGLGKQDGRKEGIMSVDLFERVVSFLSAKGLIGEWINLYNWGDPLLHPQLDQIIGVCQEKGLRIIVSSNLSVPGQRLKPLVDHGVDLLIVSVSGMSQTTYGKNHKGGDFVQVRRNIERLAKYRDTIKEIVLKYLVFNHNRDDIELARDFCKEQGISFGAYAGAIPSPESFFEYLEDPRCREVIEEFVPAEQIRLQPARACPQETSITVNPQAELEMCCVSWKHGYGASIFDADMRDYLENRVKNDFCAKCLASGYSHYKHFGVISPDLLFECLK